MRSLGAAALALLAGAATMGGCAPPGSPTSPPPSDTVTIVFRYSHFSPSTIVVPAGVPVTFTLQNDDPIEHEWIVGLPELHAAHRLGTEAFHEGRPNEVTVPAFSERTTTLTFEPTGDGAHEYAFVCHLPAHEAYGMRGALRVLTKARAPSPRT